MGSRSMMLLLVLLFSAACPDGRDAPAGAGEPPVQPAEENRYVHPGGAFSLVPPPGWVRMDPPRPGTVVCFGNATDPEKGLGMMAVTVLPLSEGRSYDDALEKLRGSYDELGAEILASGTRGSGEAEARWMRARLVQNGKPTDSLLTFRLKGRTAYLINVSLDAADMDRFEAVARQATDSFRL